MKSFPLVLLTCAFAISSLAQVANTNTAAGSTTAAKKAKPPIASFQMSDAVIAAPFVRTNGSITQPETTDVAGGGKATFSFTITNAGNYVLRGVASAPMEEANSFYVNIDAQPEDPTMIWDIEVTTGFEDRSVNWRGDGEPGGGALKVFKLATGAHKLFVVGREPALLKSISICPAD